MGAYAVHHGRYLVAHCSHAHEELGGGPHGLLSLIAPLAGCLLAMTTVRLATRLIRRRAATQPSRVAVWLGATVMLAAAYGFAEFAEGRFDAAHRAGLSGALGHGGSSALLIAIAIGAVLALLYKASAHVIRRFAKALTRRRVHAAPTARYTGRSPFVQVPDFAYLSLYAGRGPPLRAVLS